MCVESAGTGGVANSQYQRPVEDPRQKDGTATKQMPSGVVDSLQGKKPKTTKGAEVVEELVEGKKKVSSMSSRYMVQELCECQVLASSRE